MLILVTIKPVRCGLKIDIMKKLLLLFFVFCLISACKKNAESKVDSNVESNTSLSDDSKVDRNSFAFKCPEDWKVTEEELLDEGVYYLSVEKNGFDSSGLMSITTFNYSLDLNELIFMNAEEIRNNTLLNNLNFDSIIDNQFNNINSRSSKFNFNAMGVNHEGVIHAFNSDNYTYVILKQEAIEDNKTNEEGFRVIEKSFFTK